MADKERDKQTITKKRNVEFEFCKVCKLNHNQGRRHNYIPNHTKALASFLSRYLKKLADIQFFLKNPALLRPENASHSRLWCVFCDLDIEEVDSLFVCNNAIRHLASLEHLKKLKNFLWKYGGGMDKVDSFRVSDTDLAQWEKKCKTVQTATPSSSGRICVPLLGDSNDIHDNVYFDNLNNIERNRFPSVDLSVSNVFLPSQKFTNEKSQVSHAQVSQLAELGPQLHETISPPVIVHNNLDMQGTHINGSIANDLTVYRANQQTPSNCQKSSAGWSPNLPGVGRLSNQESNNRVLQTLTEISSLLPEGSKENVHSGAPPPWFDTTEESQQNGQISTRGHINGRASSSRKSQKLNPNRVGAAWAEKRKIELEREKRGETVADGCDANWLPNFGRVWQSGSRKESRKEFQIENEKSSKRNSSLEVPVKIQPYISKRMVSLLSLPQH
ncbi:hypothetical protein ACHQM5_010541 [Ranunculus cassubicifolius]